MYNNIKINNLDTIFLIFNQNDTSINNFIHDKFISKLNPIQEDKILYLITKRQNQTFKNNFKYT